MDYELLRSIITGSISTANIIVGLTIRELWTKGEKLKALLMVVLAGGGSALAIYLANKYLR